MIPFRDNIRSRTTPVVTVSLIIVNSAAFLYEISLGPGISLFLFRYGVVPTNVFEWPGSGQPFTTLVLPFFTSMFLHGGFMHLLGNMWYLWIFGDNVEDTLGHFGFLAFYLAAGIGAGLVHAALNYYVSIPTVGASGAIAGVLGAYMLLYPFARVLTVIPMFILWPVVEVPALLVLGFWFIVQFLSGAGSLAMADGASGGVAWWAHIGGFLLGMLLLPVFRRRPPQTQPAVRVVRR